MLTFKNLTKGPKEIATKGGGYVMIDPGQTSAPVEVLDADREIAKASGWFEIADAGEPAPVVAQGGADGAADDQSVVQTDDFDKLSDADLTATYTDIVGSAPHHKAKRETILKNLRAFIAGQAVQDEGEAV
jgi:hypothetical protein